MIDSAQLSELRGSTATAPQDLEKFSRERAGDEGDAWQDGVPIIGAHYAPFRANRK